MLNEDPTLSLILDSIKDTPVIMVKTEPKRIVFISALFASYEGIALVRTVDNKSGIIEILASPELVEEVLKILKDLSYKWQLSILEIKKEPRSSKLFSDSKQTNTELRSKK